MAPGIQKTCPELTCERELTDWRWFSRGATSPTWLAELTGRLVKSQERVFSLRADGAQLFVKRTALHGLRRRVRATWRIESDWLGGKGPILEAKNSLLAERVGVPVPALLAYGERPARGLARESVLVFEEITDARTLALSMQEHAAHPSEVLPRAWALVEHLARQPLVHLDLHANNILIADAGPSGDRVIDFEICARAAGEPAEVFAFYLGNLWRRGGRGVLTPGDYDAFAEAALESALDGPDLVRGRERYLVYRSQRFGFGERRRLIRRR